MRESEGKIQAQKEPTRAVIQTELTEGRRNRGQMKHRQPWEGRAIVMVKRIKVSALGTSGPGLTFPTIRDTALRAMRYYYGAVKVIALPN